MPARFTEALGRFFDASQWQPSTPLLAVRWFWARLLFPCQAPIESGICWQSLALVIVLPALLMYPQLNFRLLEPDEGRYAEIPREMLAHGHLVTPLLQGDPYLDKPPLMYWLVMLSYTAFGTSEVAARIVPALAIHGVILLTYGFGRRLVGEKTAVRAALLLGLAPGIVTMGRLLILDGLLTFWITLGLFAGYFSIQATTSPRGRWGYWCLMALAIAFGGLTKGPVALLLVLGPLLAERWLHPHRTVPISTRSIAGLLAVVLAINLPWYVAVCVENPQFGPYFFWQHNVLRFLAPFDHLEPVGYYVPLLLALLFPGSLLFWKFGRCLLSDRPAAIAKRTPELGFCALCGFGIVLFFSLSGSKLPTYILPAFPMLALVLASMLERWPTRIAAGWWLVLLVGQHWALPMYAELRSPMCREAVLRELCSDPDARVICFPRHCDSVAFYLQREDLDNYRTKEAPQLHQELQKQRRTVVLFTHRTSLQALQFALPPNLEITRIESFERSGKSGSWLTKLAGNTPWGLCHIAVVQKRD